MKNLFLLGLGCALASPALAQTEKGAHYIGANVGNLSYASGKNGPKQYSFALQPTAGVFVADNVLLGATASVSHARIKFEDITGFNGTSLWTYGLSPFARLYLPGTSPHRFFGQLQGGIGRGTGRQADFFYGDERRYSDTYGQAAASIGYNYFLTPSAALEVNANYTRNFSNSYDINRGVFGISAGFAVFLPSKGTAAPTN